MFTNIEKAIRKCWTLVVEEERYGSHILMGMDYNWNPYPDVIKDLVNQATSAGDMDAMAAFDLLMESAEKYPEFPFVRAETLEQGFKKLDERMALCLLLNNDQIEERLETLNFNK